ncbi:MAG: hypothetical protein M0010_22115 [Actinomycetota bacterium]|nr:hypothetical protein [Actinomycetota bacterium]
MSRRTNCWDELLDTLEERLWRWRAAASGAPEPGQLSWPDVGPLPRRLEVRARALLDGYAEVEAAMAHHHDDLRILLERARAGSRPTGTPLFVDRRA